MFAPWLLWRVALPLAIAAAVTLWTWGNTFFEVFSALLLSTFVAHLLVTIGLKRTDVLDTGSYFPLIFLFSVVADYSEAEGYAGKTRWKEAAVALAVYLCLSFMGRYRAARDAPDSNPTVILPPKLGRWPRLRRAIFRLTILGGIGLLGLAIWPGVLEDVVIQLPFCLLALPLLLFWFLLLVGLAVFDLARNADPTNSQPRWGLRAAGLMFATMALLFLHVPQRIEAAILSWQLNKLADAAVPGAVAGDRPARNALGRQLGPYFIDSYGVDQDGGVYFRTHTGPDGLGPDQTSYGFARRPNGPPTPFGSARYRQRRLFGE